MSARSLCHNSSANLECGGLPPLLQLQASLSTASPPRIPSPRHSSLVAQANSRFTSPPSSGESPAAFIFLSIPEVYGLRHEVVPHQMEKNRRGKTQRVNAIQDSAVSFDHSAEVLNPMSRLIALITRPRKIPNANGERHSRGLQRRKRRGPPERRAQRRRAQNPAEKPFPGFVGTHAPGDFVPPEQFAHTNCRTSLI